MKTIVWGTANITVKYRNNHLSDNVSMSYRKQSEPFEL